VEVVVLSDAPAVAREAAERVISAANRAVAARGAFSLVLSGGSTPEMLYRLLAAPANRDRLDWSRTEIFFGDERRVPPDHEWSNYAMARRTLIDHVAVLPENVHRIAGELPPAEAASAYASGIRQALADPELSVPRFDLVLLGMGDDGHTASLFPGMPALLERDAWVVGTGVPQYVRPQVDRVTLTYPVINAAREVLFLVTGENKAEPMRKILREAPSQPADALLPAARVKPNDGMLTWLLEPAAASLLGGE
jgi:6-phosphogluconolactonase